MKLLHGALIVLLAGHGLVHLMGVAKAFGYADLPQLTLSISRPWGAVWLLAGGLVLATTAMLATGVRGYWLVGACAVIVSQAVIAAFWRDAWAGTGANAILLVLVVHGFLTEGPWSFHADYLRTASIGLARPFDARPLTEDDLARLPDPVRRYLRVTHAVGQPRVQNYRIRFVGRIRSAPAARWMPFTADQQSFADQPTRLFLMRARMFGVPVQAFHRLVDGRATMRVTVAGVAPIVNTRGDEMDRAETVTLFNDMCILAPGTLIASDIEWYPLNATSARARFTQYGHSIAATLFFDADGRLVNFESDDRSRATPDGTMARVRFSTPLRDYRDFGPLYLAGYGEARWHLPEGVFTYGEFTMLDVVANAVSR